MEDVYPLTNSIEQIVRAEKDPAKQIVLCSQVHDALMDLVSTIGSYGLRGQAAQQLRTEEGSTKAALARILATTGVEMTPQTFDRLVQR